MQLQAKSQVRREHENKRMNLQLMNDTISSLLLLVERLDPYVEDYKET